LDGIEVTLFLGIEQQWVTSQHTDLLALWSVDPMTHDPMTYDSLTYNPLTY